MMIQYQAQVDRTNLVNVELTIEVNELKEAVKNAETNKGVEQLAKKWESYEQLENEVSKLISKDADRLR